MTWSHTCPASGPGFRIITEAKACPDCGRNPGDPQNANFDPMAEAKPGSEAELREHPLYPIFMAAIEQAMYGKGERHGGARTPFMKQPWAHYVAMHGRGFATGQAAKKLEEAASTRSGTAFETEVFGAIVYIGMAVLAERGVLATKTNNESEA